LILQLRIGLLWFQLEEFGDRADGTIGARVSMEDIVVGYSYTN